MLEHSKVTVYIDMQYGRDEHGVWTMLNVERVRAGVDADGDGKAEWTGSQRVQCFVERKSVRE